MPALAERLEDLRLEQPGLEHSPPSPMLGSSTRPAGGRRDEGMPWSSAIWTSASAATSSCRATRRGRPRDRPGTWRPTSGPSPSCTRSPRTTSSPPSASRREHGLRIAFNAGGHNAGPIDWSRDTLLLKTERMDGITIDPERQRARVEAGALSRPLAVAAGEHGLAYLAGTSPNVGVLGYALGGGLSWLIRTHGLACNTIVAADVVTADGRLVHADHDTEPELFWALRGGGGNVGAVTAIELELFPIPELYAGALFWPIERASEILHAWRAWIETVPEACESLGRMLQLPDVPFLPENVRGRSFVLVEVAITGDPDAAAALVQPLRDLGPEIDTVGTMPHERAERRQHGPRGPAAVHGRGHPARRSPAGGDRPDGRGLRRLDAPARRGPPPGRRGRRADQPDHGLLDAIDQPFVCFTFGLGFDAPMLEAVDAPRPPPARRPRPLGQRSPVPELRRVADGSPVDLPRRGLRPARGGEGPVRPHRPVPRQPLR